MSEWIVAAASSAVWPRRSVHARVSLSPAVKKVIRPSASFSRRTTSSSAERPVAERRPPPRRRARRAPPRARSRSRPGRSRRRSQRLRRQRLELGRQLLAAVGERAAGLEVREEPLEARRPPAQLRGSPDFACFCDPLEPPLDVVAVGDEQLELQRLEVACGSAPAENPSTTASSASTWRRLPSSCGAGAGDVDDADRGRRHLARARRAREPRRGGRRRSRPCRRSPCRSPMRRR